MKGFMARLRSSPKRDKRDVSTVEAKQPASGGHPEWPSLNIVSNAAFEPVRCPLPPLLTTTTTTGEPRLA